MITPCQRKSYELREEYVREIPYQQKENFLSWISMLDGSVWDEGDKKSIWSGGSDGSHGLDLFLWGGGDGGGDGDEEDDEDDDEDGYQREYVRKIPKRVLIWIMSDGSVRDDEDDEDDKRSIWSERSAGFHGVDEFSWDGGDVGKDGDDEDGTNGFFWVDKESFGIDDGFVWV